MVTNTNWIDDAFKKAVQQSDEVSNTNIQQDNENNWIDEEFEKNLQIEDISFNDYYANLDKQMDEASWFEKGAIVGKEIGGAIGRFASDPFDKEARKEQHMEDIRDEIKEGLDTDNEITTEFTNTMQNNFGFLDAKDFAVDDKSLSSISDYVRKNVQDELNFKKSISEIEGTDNLMEGQIKKSYDRYKDYKNVVFKELSKGVKELINKQEKVTSEDVESLIEQNETLNKYDKLLDQEKDWLQSKITTSSIQEQAGQTLEDFSEGNILGGIGNVFQTLGVTAQTAGSWGLTGLEGFKSSGIGGVGDLSQLAADKIENVPIIGGKASSVLDKFGDIIDWTAEAGSDLADLEANLSTGAFGNIESVANFVMGAVPTTASLALGGVASNAARLNMINILGASKSSGWVKSLIGNVGGTAIGTDLFIDGVANHLTQTRLTDKVIAQDMLFNSIFGLMADGVLGGIKARKSYLTKKAQDELMNKSIIIQGFDTNGKEIVEGRRLGGLFKDYEQLEKFVIEKGDTSLKILDSEVDTVLKEIDKLKGEKKESDIIRQKREFNEMFSKYFSTENYDLKGFLRKNSTKSGTNELFDKYVDAYKNYSKEMKIKMEEIKKIYEFNKANKVKGDTTSNLQIGTLTKGLKASIGKNEIKKYLEGLNNIEVKLDGGEKRKVSITEEVYNKIDTDINYDGVISENTIADIIKNINKDILGKGEIPLSEYIKAIKQTLGDSKEFVNDDLKRIFNLNNDALEGYAKIIDEVNFKKEPEIGKTSKNVEGNFDIMSNIIKLGRIYNKFNKPEDFAVVLMHELTHLTEPALRQIWGDELVGNLQSDWGFFVEGYRNLTNTKPIKSFNSYEDIDDFLGRNLTFEDEIEGLKPKEFNTIEDVVDFHLKLKKTADDGIINKEDVQNYLQQYKDIFIKQESERLISKVSMGNFINNKDIVIDDFTKYDKDYTRKILKAENMEKTANYSKSTIEQSYKHKQMITQTKEKILQDIEQDYKVDADEAVNIYNKLLNNAKPLKAISDYNMKAILGEMTSTDIVGGKIKGFSEYLAYTLSEYLVKGDNSLDGFVNKISNDGIKVGSNRLQVSKENLKKAGNILKERKFEGLDEYIINNIKSTNNIQNSIVKDADTIKYYDDINISFQKAMKTKSVDAVLSYVNSLNAEDLKKLLVDNGYYTGKEIDSLLDNFSLEEAKRYIGNSITIGTKNGNGLALGGLFEVMMKGLGRESDLTTKFKDKFRNTIIKDNKFKEYSKYFDSEDGGKINIDELSKLLRDDILNEKGTANQYIINTIKNVLKDIIDSQGIYNSSKKLEGLLKINGRGQNSIDVLSEVHNIYKGYENYFLYKLLTNLDKKTEGALQIIKREDVEFGAKYNKVISSGKISGQKELIESINELQNRLGDKGKEFLGYILRQGKSTGDSINFSSAINKTNLALFHKIQSMLGVKQYNDLFSTFVRNIRDYGNRNGMISETNFNVNKVFNLYGYNFKGSKKQLNTTIQDLYFHLNKGRDLNLAFEIININRKNTGLTKYKGTANIVDFINDLDGKINSAKLSNLTKDGKLTYSEYIDAIFDIFDPHIAKTMSRKLLSGVNRGDISTLRKQINDNYNLYKSRDNIIDEAIGNSGDLGVDINVSRGKYGDVYNPLQRRNIELAGIGDDMYVLTDDTGTRYNIKKNNNNEWVIDSVRGSTSYALNKESIISKALPKSNLEFNNKISNITKNKSIKKILENCIESFKI